MGAEATLPKALPGGTAANSASQNCSHPARAHKAAGVLG